MPLGAVSPERSIKRRKSTQYRFVISPQEYDAFLNGIRMGLCCSVAARSVGLAPSQVSEWLKRGQIYADVFEDLVPYSLAWQYARFSKDFQQAQAQFEAGHVANITKHAYQDAPGDWAASRYMLTSKLAKDYSEKYQIEKITNQKVLETIKFLFENVGESAREELAAALQMLPNLKLADAEKV